MKTEGALARRFLRHDGIYRSDVSLLLVNLGRGAASRSGPGQAIGRAGRNTPCPSSTMSSGRLFLDRDARQQCPSPLHRQRQHKAIATSGQRNYHRTVDSVLTVCLTKRGNPRKRMEASCSDLRISATRLGGSDFLFRAGRESSRTRPGGPACRSCGPARDTVPPCRFPSARSVPESPQRPAIREGLDRRNCSRLTPMRSFARVSLQATQ